MSISWNASLPIRAARHVARDRDHRDRVEEGGPDPGHEVRGAGSGGAHADPDLAGHPGVAVGGMGPALLVADEDVAQLGVVAEDVVERQDHAAGVAEEDVRALEEERLADDVGPDPGAVPGPGVVEHRPAGGLDRGRVGGPVGRDVAPTRRPRRPAAARTRLGRTRRLGRPSLRHRHRSVPALSWCRSGAGPIPRSVDGIKKPSPPGEGPFGSRWSVRV